MYAAIAKKNFQAQVKNLDFVHYPVLTRRSTQKEKKNYEKNIMQILATASVATALKL